jgi:hypothetical protein
MNFNVEANAEIFPKLQVATASVPRHLNTPKLNTFSIKVSKLTPPNYAVHH